jgi:hypothetical protein
MVAGANPSKLPPEKKKKNLHLWNDAYCYEVIEFLAKGFSLHAFAGKIRRTSETVRYWYRTKKEFRECVEIGRAACRFFMENQMLENMDNKNFNFAMMKFLGHIQFKDMRVTQEAKIDVKAKITEDIRRIQAIPVEDLIKVAKENLAYLVESSDEGTGSTNRLGGTVMDAEIGSPRQEMSALPVKADET